jgi:predicted site-specific integrase-resolvase
MEYLNTKEAAKRLRVSARTLEKWRVQGTGPVFLKIGRLCFYTEDAITAWLNSRRRESTSDPRHAVVK